MKNATRDQELVHLEYIKTKLDIALDIERQSLEVQRQELISERKNMWEDAAHNVMDFDDIVSISSYDTRVREEFSHYVRKDEMVRQLKYLRSTPYFGRIDFKEDGLSEEDSIYIGRYGFCEKNTYEYDIYDWRTPIANMFYECMVGRASYLCPAGEITGQLTCKRQYQIKDGELEYYYDTNLAVQDEMLGKVLAENTDKVLRVIIDTITKEQNGAIRQSGNTDLLITGPAGSGKTSVGMHRLAYLLYNNRSNLSSDKIVVLSRNQIFSSYISRILPELGEENVQDILFDDLINRGIPKEYHKCNYYEQVEYLLKNQKISPRMQGICIKYSAEFWDYVKETLKVLRVRKHDMDVAIEVYLYCLKNFTFSESEDVYAFTKKMLDGFELLYEDMLAIGYIRILLRGIRHLEQISHVVVDEAQDYNRLQLMIMRAIYPKAKFTILADLNQAVYPEISTIKMEVFHQIFGKNLKEMQLKKSYRSTAPINRFAFDILGIHDTELYVDRPGKEPEYIISDKNRAESKMEELITLIQGIPKDKSVAVLTTQRETAWNIKVNLGSSVPEDGRMIEYILRPDKELEEKIVVMPIMLAKGLEFDVVIVWDDESDVYWEDNKHLKYLMCTRALHELYFIK